MGIGSFFRRRDASGVSRVRRGRVIAAVVTVLVLVLGGLAYFKADEVLRKITTGESGIFESLVKSLPGVEQKLEGEEEGRIDIALIAMRGANVDGGGLLADTIMVLSIHPSSGEGDAPRASLVSIPRDLYVTVPDTSDRQKINSVYFYGEEKGGLGKEYMKRVLSDVTGLPIRYAATIDFAGFTALVDALGGIDVTLAEPFMEGVQFHEPHVCDDAVFTKPMTNDRGQQMYECKYSKKPRSSQAYVKPTWDPYPLCTNKPKSAIGIYKVMAQYPMCYNENEECGGVFALDAGGHHFDGKTALCYVRSRYGSSDFDRARRQQEVMKLIKTKAISIGTLTDFGKVSDLLSALGNNVTTDLEGWELKRFYELYGEIGDVALTQKVLENSEEGLLYAPDSSGPAGYILLPIGDSYNRIHELFEKLP